MKRIFSLLTTGAFVLFLFGLVGEVRQTAVSYQTVDLPELFYLGKGGSYTNDPEFNFIIKKINPFRFEYAPGPTYNASPDEDVWRSFGTGGAPPALYEEDIKLADVSAGCRVRYIAIDDQMDGRRNRFLLDETDVIHLMPEGMVVRGEFTVPRDAELHYDARDSVAIYIDICGSYFGVPTPTPVPGATQTPTGTATPTETALPTLTPTVDPTMTPTLTTTAVITPTATVDLTTTPTMTPTSPEGTTATPGSILMTVTPTPTTPSLVVTATPTRQAQKACLRINFEVGGDVAKDGRYIVREVGGRELYSWTAKAGWQDSGWAHEISISHESVYVNVFYEAPDGSETQMVMLNPAPGTPYGWLTRGMCHALEVAWP